MKKLLIILLLFVACEDKQREIEDEISLTGTWKSDHTTSKGDVYIFTYDLVQKDTIILCNGNSYVKLGEYNISWQYIEGTIKGNQVYMLLNSAQNPEYYDLNYRIWEGVLSGDVMDLKMTLASNIDGILDRSGHMAQHKFIRQ